MKRIYDVEKSVRLLDDHIPSANQHKLGVGHRVLFPIGRVNDKWPRPSEIMPNEFAIHRECTRSRLRLSQGAIVKSTRTLPNRPDLKVFEYEAMKTSTLR
jgi:hypothetical protein